MNLPKDLIAFETKVRQARADGSWWICVRVNGQDAPDRFPPAGPFKTRSAAERERATLEAKIATIAIKPRGQS